MIGGDFRRINKADLRRRERERGGHGIIEVVRKKMKQHSNNGALRISCNLRKSRRNEGGGRRNHVSPVCLLHDEGGWASLDSTVKEGSSRLGTLRLG